MTTPAGLVRISKWEHKDQVPLNGKPIEPGQYSDGWDPVARLQAVDHIRHAASLGLPALTIQPQHARTAVIVGGSPGVAQHIEEIRAWQRRGAFVFAINHVYNLLLEAGIVADGMLLFEIGLDPCALGWRLQPQTEYQVCTLCHPDTFKAAMASGGRVFTWNSGSNLQEHHDVTEECFPNQPMVAGGISTFTRILPVATGLMGYRNFEVYGVTCSHEKGGDTHFFGTPFYRGSPYDVYAGQEPWGRWFHTTKLYARQAEEFRQTIAAFGQMMNMRVHGDGLVPFIHREMFPGMYPDTVPDTAEEIAA